MKNLYEKCIFTAVLITVVCWCLTYQITKEDDRKCNTYPYCKTIVMGQFNYASKNLSTWKNCWSKVVDEHDIVLAIPKEDSGKNSLYGVYPFIAKRMFYNGDNGYYSPYINMKDIIKETRYLRGILYVHDDLVLTSSVLQKVGGNEWIATNSQDRDIITIHETSKVDSAKNAPTWWSWWNGCFTAFTKMFTDERLKPYLHQTSNQTSYINVTWGQSDMLYAYLPDLEQKNSFLKLLEMFAENELFLECAIPTALLMMQKRFGIKLHNALLCTDWGDLRTKPKEMIDKCMKDEKNYEAYHPIKISYNKNWTHYFDYLTQT